MTLWLREVAYFLELEKSNVDLGLPAHVGRVARIATLKVKLSRRFGALHEEPELRVWCQKRSLL